MADIAGYLKTIRDGQSGETVRDAIINCMRDINEDGQVKKASLVITKPDNVTYKPGKGKAFSSVTVNITGGESNPNKTIHYETMTVTELTENGTYPTEEQPDTYYDKVEVAIDWDKVSHPSNLGEEADMTTYETDENGNKYWDAQLAGFDYVKRIWIPNSIASGLPGGDYPGANTNGPFKVSFYDRTNDRGTPHLITTLSVEKNGNAGELFTSKGNTTPSVGGRFLQWSPSVAHVTGDMKTYAVYTNNSTGTVEDLGTRPWSEIINMPASDLLGKYKLLEVVADDGQSRVSDLGSYSHQSRVYENPSDPESSYITLSIADPTIKFSVRMQCVAAGEGGSKTSWLAMDPLPSNWLMNGNSTISDNGLNQNAYGRDDWMSCHVHDVFDRLLYKAMPSDLKGLIKEVTKPTWGIMQYPPVVGDNNKVLKMVPCKIWLPSLGEVDDIFSDYVENDPPYQPLHRDKEPGSINYSGWQPNMLSQNGVVNLRSLVRWTNYVPMGAYQHITTNEVKKYIPSTYNGFANTVDLTLYIGFCL